MNPQIYNREIPELTATAMEPESFKPLGETLVTDILRSFGGRAYWIEVECSYDWDQARDAATVTSLTPIVNGLAVVEGAGIMLSPAEQQWVFDSQERYEWTRECIEAEEGERQEMAATQREEAIHNRRFR